MKLSIKRDGSTVGVGQQLHPISPERDFTIECVFVHPTRWTENLTLSIVVDEDDDAAKWLSRVHMSGGVGPRPATMLKVLSQLQPDRYTSNPFEIEISADGDFQVVE